MQLSIILNITHNINLILIKNIIDVLNYINLNEKSILLLNIINKHIIDYVTSMLNHDYDKITEINKVIICKSLYTQSMYFYIIDKDDNNTTMEIITSLWE